MLHKDGGSARTELDMILASHRVTLFCHSTVPTCSTEHLAIITKSTARMSAERINTKGNRDSQKEFTGFTSTSSENEVVFDSDLTSVEPSTIITSLTAVTPIRAVHYNNVVSHRAKMLLLATAGQHDPAFYSSTYSLGGLDPLRSLGYYNSLVTESEAVESDAFVPHSDESGSNYHVGNSQKDSDCRHRETSVTVEAVQGVPGGGRLVEKKGTGGPNWAESAVARIAGQSTGGDEEIGIYELDLLPNGAALMRAITRYCGAETLPAVFQGQEYIGGLRAIVTRYTEGNVL